MARLISSGARVTAELISGADVWKSFFKLPISRLVHHVKYATKNGQTQSNSGARDSKDDAFVPLGITTTVSVPFLLR